MAIIPTDIRIHYDLSDLTTAQHKAGLAGLLLLIQSMAGRQLIRQEEVILKIDATAAELCFTEESVKAIFDDLYAAKRVEVSVRSKWPNTPPKEERMVDDTDEEGKATRTKRFIYEVVQPAGMFLQERYPDADGLWLKLWRDMIWAIPRGIPLTRKPYEECSAGASCKLGKDAWLDLLKVKKAATRNQFYTTGLAGSLWLGAQDTNAELIPFQGRAEHNLLLHFWQLTALVFVPQQITIEGDTEFVGFAIAIPEVADLQGFIQDYPRMLNELGAAKHGYRPAEAVIDLPDEGALAFLEHLAHLTQQISSANAVRFSVNSVDFFHMKKEGNRILLLASGRIAPNANLLREYRHLTGNKSPYRNPIFRRGLLRALLNEGKWYEALAESLFRLPAPFFIRSQDSPKKVPWFWQDAAAKFNEIQRDVNSILEAQRMTNSTEPEVPSDDQLALIVHRLVQNYVNSRTEDRSRLKWEDFKDKKIKDEKTGKERVDIPEAYREAKEKTGMSLFLEMRSRRDQDFVDHFTATFCAVRQYLPVDDYAVIVRALLQNPNRVKTIALVALSANS